MAAGCFALSLPAHAQTVIYDGSQALNFFGASHLDDTTMLYNNPVDPTRNGVANAGADPNALEVGDAAWFKSTGRRMRNTNLGSAGAATGVDGDFMSSLFDASGATVDGQDDLGVGAGYFLYDAGATTGRQLLNISLYYNDPTPNATDPDNPGDINDGSNVAIRVFGLHAFNSNADPDDPWDDDRFTFLAGNGASGALIAAGNHRPEAGDPVDPIVDNLFTASSNAAHLPDEFLAPSAAWQELSFQFDAGTGYDYLIFAVGGVVQDPDGTNSVLGVDRFGFDNISFEAAPGVAGDFDGDLDVDGADFLEWQRSDATPAGLADWQSNFGSTSALATAASIPEPATSSLLVIAATGLLAWGRQRRS
ncbi:MAG: hypothetical protein CMJ58_18645 [Planctomycetaceae bacterium]|nr:hypothetical protein [Planctomycetaceae bacterium]